MKAQLEDAPIAVADGDEIAAKRARKEARREQRLAAREARRAGRQKLASERELDNEQVAKLLEELAAGARSGHAIAKSGDEQLTLELAGTAHVRLKARSGQKKSRLTVQITWPRAKREPAAESEAT